MKQQKQNTTGNEFTSRLASSEWDRKMHVRIETERKDRLHIRVRVMAFVSAIFIGVLSITATWWEEDTTGTNLYALMEETAGSFQGQYSE